MTTRKSKPDKSARPCKYYSSGKCRHGDKCHFAHENAPSPPSTKTSEPQDTADILTGSQRPKSTNMPGSSRGNAQSSDIKNEICKHWQRGSCRFSSGCRSSHTLVPTTGLNAPPTYQSVMANAPPTYQSIMGSTTPSRAEDHVNSGSTKFSDHSSIVGASITNAVRAANRTYQLPARSQTSPAKPCFAWAAKGTCFKGSRCPYSHDPSICERLHQSGQQRPQRETLTGTTETDVRRLREEFARREAELQGQMEEARTRREAELQRQREEERRRRELELQRQQEQERMRREAELQRQREEERARREAQRQRQLDMERERRQAERARRQREIALVDARRRITREVDQCLVTFSAGLAVQEAVASFDILRGRISNLPNHVQAKYLTDFLGLHGVSDTSYSLNKTPRNDFAFVIISSSSAAQLYALPPLDGVDLTFTPVKTGFAGGEQAGGTAFARTLTVNILLQPFAPADCLDVVRNHLETRARRLGLSGLHTATSAASKGATKARFEIQLDSWDHARDLRDDLRRIGAMTHGSYRIQFGNNLFLPSKYSYPLFMTHQQYAAQKTQWDELAQRCQQDSCEIKTRDLPDGKVRISLFGNEVASVGPMKVRAEQLAFGTIINMWNRRLFDRGVERKLQEELREATGAHVQVDRRLRCLRAYGSPAAIELVRQHLEFYAEELARNEYTRELSSQKIVRFFVDTGYQQLTETYGEDAVTMDLTSSPKKITVTGDEEVRHRLDKLWDDSLKDLADARPVNGGTEDPDCPICMCPVTAPTELSCGHIYCTQCLTHFIKSGLESTSFPLKCSADEARCGAPIAISLLEKFLHPSKFQQLLETAFHAYMEQNPDVLAPCTTPGCTQLFARDASGRNDGSKVAKCPSCFVSACAACAKGAHQGVSCELAGRDLSEEYINADREVRRCPNCQTPIFKDGGCNHVECRCGRHICWRCMDVSATSTQCYTHMRERHNGIFEEEMDPPEARRHDGARAEQRNFANIPAEYLAEDALARAQPRELPGNHAVDHRAAFERELRRLRADELRNDELNRQRQLAAQRIGHAENLAQQMAAARRLRQEEVARERRNAGGGWCVVM